VRGCGTTAYTRDCDVLVDAGRDSSSLYGRIRWTDALGRRLLRAVWGYAAKIRRYLLHYCLPHTGATPTTVPAFMPRRRRHAAAVSSSSSVPPRITTTVADSRELLPDAGHYSRTIVYQPFSVEVWDEHC
jgi:hypothetical protein